VIENLTHYLTQAEDLIKKNAHDQEQQYVELCLLVIQCLEVSLQILMYCICRMSLVEFHKIVKRCILPVPLISFKATLKMAVCLNGYHIRLIF
jgi:hypothetical protein